ncbi:MAG: WbqC family protein [Myxococcaceae bacterium]|nr:WbqC family protein [Myxococcaceae bacterium]
MRATIHQPNYLPNAGFFHKILQCDRYVVYDTAQFVRSRFDNRNFIKTNNAKVFMTVPITSDSHFKPIAEARVNNSTPWREKHWKTLKNAYQKAPHFAELAPALEDIYSTAPVTLPDMSLPIIRRLLALLGWKGQMVLSSELPLDRSLRSTDAIIDILRAVKATSYLAGASSKKYLVEEAFVRSGITLEYHHFSPPVYRQLGEPFIPNLCALDLVFNEGPAAREILYCADS